MSPLGKLFLHRTLSPLLRRHIHKHPYREKPVVFQREKLWETQTKKHIFRAFVVICSSYLTYRTIKERYGFIPHVNAASTFEGKNLAGRRQQFNFIADVVQSAAPAVVYIEIKDARRVDFFTGRPLTLSNGSGFIIQSDGLIVTNAHVVTNKPSAIVEVRLLDGRTFKGVVEDIDVKSDLATVRIPTTNLPTMKLGSSADLKPGEFVVAIGSPLALSNTVTTGVVSSAQRGSEELGLTGKDMNYIQTDAAITFGNSGGPLVNLDGEAIGVNSMKVTPGISFAIPIDYVKDFLRKAKGPKKPSDAPKRVYLGITMFTLTPQLINELALKQGNRIPEDFQGGVLVWKVITGSPANRGGLQPGDIVTHINSKQIRSAQDVYEILKNTETKNLKMSVQRQDRHIEINVQPEDLS
ncbi:serine protease HTRA2, mitochondrial-like [Anthonomus grandis grandis]|uniref:serine protease HTRA2, mitochondrial-like n=1 Tax=Anthonomus grandis grandis TaxID=2921223 RepID=UPI0021656F71|nr:serine protease HTRA2, mitochondrial-like [Anthonomus grandis grandis]